MLTKTPPLKEESKFFTTQKTAKHSCYSSTYIWHTGLVPAWKYVAATTSKLAKEN